MSSLSAATTAVATPIGVRAPGAGSASVTIAATTRRPAAAARGKEQDHKRDCKNSDPSPVEFHSHHVALEPMRPAIGG
jgi:hypothetical protein